MTLARALQVAAGNSQESADVAEAIDFDGTNDYLSRSTDLTGNADGKAFTFSFWVWLNDLDGSLIYNGNGRLVVRVNSGQINIYGKNTSDVDVLYFNTDVIPQNTWTHILVSLDLASTSNRYVYINDVQQTISWTTYTNTNVDRASTGTWYAPNSDLSTRVSNLFMDYTYRDLSVTANRRLFITADRKPAADQAALNPILYLPMDDPTQPGLNAGTGGNFTLTGTVARSGRGPNQYNAPYSTFDGASDYLSRTTALTGLSDGKTFTINLNFSVISGTTKYIVTFGSYAFAIIVNSSGSLSINANNSAGTQILLAATPNGSIVNGRNYTLTASMDLANTANRAVYLNGVAQSVTWSIYTNDTIDFALATPSYVVGRNISTTYFNGNIGAFYFHTSYIDLSQPANLAKFVTGTGIDAKPVDLGANGELPTGTAPIIYLPMYGNNAGKNYGTGGDFTVNSGPYTGARGPNEFWGNLATFNGTNSYLSKSGAISGLSNSKTFSLSLFFNKTLGTTTDYLISWPTTGGNHTLFFNTATSMNQSWRNTLGNAALGGWTPTIPDATNVHLLICVDMDDVNKCKIYINGTVHAGTPGTFVTGTTLDFASINNPFIGVFDSASLSSVFNGKLSEFYFTNQYIDFTQEANRLKFRDAFGNPVNLTQQIEDAAIPNPAIYMRFPPTSFGTNSGTGGNFTVNGTISDGGQL